MLSLKEKRILVTGASGFLGSHVSAALTKHGCTEVYGATSKSGDLTDPEMAGELFDSCRPEVVFHLAARVGGIGANQRSPADFWRDNLMMGINIIHQSSLHRINKLVMVGTVCSYPKMPKSTPFVEEELFDGYPEPTNAPYGIAKRALLVGAKAYHRQYGLNVVTLIPTNMYGPGDNFKPESSHVIPALIRKLEENPGKIEAWGTGAATRSFLFVEDCAQALILAAEKYDSPEPVNLAAGEEISIRNLIELLQRLMNHKGKVLYDTSKPDGQPFRCLSTVKAERYFGFEAKTRLVEGLKKTIEWRRANGNTKSN